MTDLRTAAKAALEALNSIDVGYRSPSGNPLELSFDEGKCEAAITALRAALAQQEEPQTLDEALTPPRAMAQAYENGYNAGVAHEREACAQVCEARFMGDLTREDMEARRCAAAIRARNNP